MNTNHETPQNTRQWRQELNGNIQHNGNTPEPASDTSSPQSLQQWQQELNGHAQNGSQPEPVLSSNNNMAQQLQPWQEKINRATSQPAQPSEKIDWARYRKVRWFFARAFAEVFFWDVFLNRPGLSWLRTDPTARLQRIARNYRALAINLGGVLIKLGQFLSTRVDLLPREVTSELSGLHDKIPPIPFEGIQAQIEADFSCPLSELFAHVNPKPIGAASLGQTYLASLHTGQQVVVKALRPGIEVLVETDLAVLSLAAQWLKLYQKLARRMDLDALMQEFTTVTRNELDLIKEGHNIEHFRDDFADNPHIAVPKVYWHYTATRTLTLENVGYIKIDHFERLDAVGINRNEVAQTFYDAYMEQMFVANFIHVDPHPGNLFVRPMPTLAERNRGIIGFKPGQPVPYEKDRPFQIVFVDFGMVATVPEQLRAAFREFAIGFGTRDAYRMVQSYITAGILLPGADLKRLEEVHEDMFERFWGVNMSQMQKVALEQSNYFLREYRDVIYDAPFQFRADTLFIGRAVGILSGMATNINPNFDPWGSAMPYAERFAAEEAMQNRQNILQEVIKLMQLTIKLPPQLDRVLTQAERGNLSTQTSFAPDARKLVQRLEKSVDRLTWMVISASLLIAGVLLRTANTDDDLGFWLIIGALGTFLWGFMRRD